MKQSEICKHSAAYGNLSFPVIVTDLKLNAMYFNPSASKTDVIPVTENCIRDIMDAKAMQYIRLCRTKGKDGRFSQYLGIEQARRYLVTVEREKDRLIFTLFPHPDAKDRQEKEDRQALGFGYEFIMRSSLHQLLAISDLIKAQNETVGEKSKRHVLRALRVSRQMEFVTGEHPRQIVHFPTLLRTLFDELGERLKTDFDCTITYMPQSENAAVKCNIMILRSVLLSVVASALQQKHKNIYIRYIEGPHQTVLTLNSDNGDPASATNIVMDEKALGLEVAKELIRQQQGSMFTRFDDRTISCCITMPRAEAEGAVKEHFEEYVDRSISDIEIEFANLY